MALIFPASPTNGQTHTSGSRTWTFNSAKGTWEASPTSNDLLNLKANLIGPSFTTPALGAATATSINKVAITQPATGSTLTIADGVTVNARGNITTSNFDGGISISSYGGITTGSGGSITTSTGPVIFSNTGGNGITINSTSNASATLPAGISTLARTDSGQTFAGAQAMSSTLSVIGVVTIGSGASPISISGSSITRPGNALGLQSIFIRDAQLTSRHGAIIGFCNISDYWDGSTARVALTYISHGVLGITNGAVGASSGSLSLTNLTASGTVITTPDSQTATTAAVSVATSATALTTTAPAQAITLANGTVGQVKVITHVATSGGGTAVLTPATKTGYYTITFSAVTDTVTLQYYTTIGWVIIASRGVAIA